MRDSSGTVTVVVQTIPVLIRLVLAMAVIQDRECCAKTIRRQTRNDRWKSAQKKQDTKLTARPEKPDFEWRSRTDENPLTDVKLFAADQQRPFQIPEFVIAKHKYIHCE